MTIGQQRWVVLVIRVTGVRLLPRSKAGSGDWPIHTSPSSSPGLVTSKYNYLRGKDFNVWTIKSFRDRVIRCQWHCDHLQMFFRQNQLQLFKHFPIFPTKTNYDLSLSDLFRHHWTNNSKESQQTLEGKNTFQSSRIVFGAYQMLKFNSESLTYQMIEGC